jgi:repressor LexA
VRLGLATVVRFTAVQQRIVEAILAFKVEHGYAPTVRELAAATGLSSPSTVHHHLDTLERMGVIARQPDKPRTIVVNATTEEHDEAPVEPDSAAP